MTVTDLIKKLRQSQGNETIVSVRIKFGNGSIYNDSPLTRRASPPPAAVNPLAGKSKPDRTRP